VGAVGVTVALPDARDAAAIVAHEVLWGAGAVGAVGFIAAVFAVIVVVTDPALGDALVVRHALELVGVAGGAVAVVLVLLVRAVSFTVALPLKGNAGAAGSA
jgi:hypothetical protein